MRDVITRTSDELSAALRKVCGRNKRGDRRMGEGTSRKDLSVGQVKRSGRVGRRPHREPSMVCYDNGLEALAASEKGYASFSSRLLLTCRRSSYVASRDWIWPLKRLMGREATRSRKCGRIALMLIASRDVSRKQHRARLRKSKRGVPLLGVHLILSPR